MKISKIFKGFIGIGIVTVTTLFAYSYGKFIGKEETRKLYED